MAVLELSKAAGRPAHSWSVDGSLDGGARTYSVTFSEPEEVPTGGLPALVVARLTWP